MRLTERSPLCYICTTIEKKKILCDMKHQWNNNNYIITSTYIRIIYKTIFVYYKKKKYAFIVFKNSTRVHHRRTMEVSERLKRSIITQAYLLIYSLQVQQWFRIQLTCVVTLHLLNIYIGLVLIHCDDKKSRCGKS